VHDHKSASKALDYGTDGVVVGSALLKALGDDGNISNLINIVQDILIGLEK
jgi:tryptophan synthase alpha subunit